MSYGPLSISANELENLLPFFCIIFGIFGIALPIVILRFVKSMVRENEAVAGPVMFGGTVICLAGILVGGVTFLALIGWLPSPTGLFH